MAPTEVHTGIILGILIGSEIPDSDFVVRYAGGSAKYLKHHRGPTHGLIIQPLWAALITVVLRLIWPEIGFGQLFFWTLLGCLSHVVFDFGNDYGTQGLWPFSPTRIAYDIIPIIDFYLIGLVLAGWGVSAAIPGNRQVVFAGVWVAIALYVAYRYWLRLRAFALVREAFDLSEPCGLAVPCGQGWREERVTIHPSLFSLNAWRYVVQMPGEFLVGMVRLAQRQVSKPARARNEMDRIVKASFKSQLVTTFAQWSRRPRVEVRQEEGLYEVRWSDMRYEYDRFAPFTAYAWLDDQLSLVDEGLKPKKQEKVDLAMVRRRLLMEMGKDEP